MKLNIAILPEPKVQERIFSEKHWAQLYAIGNITRNEEDGVPTEERMSRLIRDADVVITSWGCTSLTSIVLNEAPRLQYVIHAAGSVKPIMSDELWRKGIRVTGGNDALGVGVAETALAFTLTSLKNMWQLTKTTQQGGWSEGKERVRELYGLNIGVVGAGKAGRHYIRLMHNFSVQLYVYDPLLTVQEAMQLGVEKVEFYELLERCDVVSIHAPSLPSTYKMFNKETISLMKDEAILINTARGWLVDEEALAHELRTGRIYACIDVTDPEPPRSDHPFRELPNCVMTPHIAGAVNNGVKRLGQFALDELERIVKKEPLEGEIYAHQIHQLA